MSKPIYYISVRKLPGGNGSVTDALYSEMKTSEFNHCLVDGDALASIVKTMQWRLKNLEARHPRTRKRKITAFVDAEDTWHSYYAPSYGSFGHASGMALDCRRVIRTEISAFKDVMDINSLDLPKERQLSLNF